MQVSTNVNADASPEFPNQGHCFETTVTTTTRTKGQTNGNHNGNNNGNKYGNRKGQQQCAEPVFHEVADMNLN